MAPYKALHGRWCRTPLCWTELRERRVLSLELVSKTDNTVKVICDCLKAASNRQNFYADLKRKDIDFSIGDQEFLKVSPWKKALRFGRRGKLSPKFIGPYCILKRVGPIVYQLELPSKLLDPTNVTIDEIELWPNLTFDEEPVQILEQNIRVPRKKTIPLVKILWRNHGTKEAM
ncbi:uncharacterized protein [Gossypium hirsutum]|uniref:Tf2-1-like SH3-like domain-containing protein n=1 Tax=Gossypium hirsutum TaxID=3635 RepID=A0A1U8HVE9_GOSHI|nr:uncharacterized protein LOC107889969 [Gossypium hirsutum]